MTPHPPRFLPMALIALATAGIGLAGSAAAADVKVLSSNNMKPTLTALIEPFERASGHKLVATFESAGALRSRVMAGKGEDVAIARRATLDDLMKQGKIVPDSIVDVARSSMVVFVQGGATKPDIGTVEAFKHALLSAKSISYPDPGTGALSGIVFAGMLEKLGIAAQMKPKTKRAGNTAGVVRLVALGMAKLGISQFTETHGRGVELAGRVPEEAGGSIPVSAAVVAGTREPDAAKDFIKFLTSPAAVAAIRANRLEPATH